MLEFWKVGIENRQYGSHFFNIMISIVKFKTFIFA